jgi:glycosyltransferase involved in cell wall biosynthesis
MKVGVFHPGTQHSWQTATAIQDLGLLRWYATTIFYSPEKWPYKIETYLGKKASSRLHSEFMRFYYSKIDPNLVRRCGYHEWLERIARRLGYTELASKLNYIGNIDFENRVAKLSDSEPVDAVWGYDSSSAETFKHCKARGVRCILDRTIGDRRIGRRILEEAYAEFPTFFFHKKQFALDEKLIDHLDREMELADVIVAGSEFCRDTILDKEARPDLGGKVKVLNYCFDSSIFQQNNTPYVDARLPIRFLFVGQVSARKGIHLILEAFKTIPKSAATLTILGPMQMPTETFAKYADRVSYHKNVPRPEVAKYMSEADCLLLPSLFEGSSLVLLEALASGLGVIQSKNAGDAVTESTGYILNQITVAALRDAVMSVVDNPTILTGWKSNARARAGEFSFDRYRSGVNTILQMQS